MRQDVDELNELKESTSVDFTNPNDLLKNLLLRVNGTPTEDMLMNVLQHLLLLAQDTDKGQSVWQFVEDMLQRVTVLGDNPEEVEKDSRISLAELSRRLKAASARRTPQGDAIPPPYSPPPPLGEDIPPPPQPPPDQQFSPRPPRPPRPYPPPPAADQSPSPPPPLRIPSPPLPIAVPQSPSHARSHSACSSRQKAFSPPPPSSATPTWVSPRIPTPPHSQPSLFHSPRLSQTTALASMAAAKLPSPKTSPRSQPSSPRSSPPPPPPPPPPPSHPSPRHRQQHFPEYTGPQPTKKTCRLYWMKVPLYNVGKTIWVKNKLIEGQVDVNASALEDLFALTSAASKAGPVQHVQTLPSKTLCNLSIALRSKHITKYAVPELVELLSTGSEKLSTKTLQILHKALLKEHEVEALQAHATEKALLPACEAFLLSMYSIPNYTSKLAILLCRSQFDSNIANFESRLRCYSTAVGEISGNTKLESVLQTILFVGNFLNFGTHQGNAVGFKMESLTRLHEVRSPLNSRVSLLHYIVDLVEKTNPNCITFYEQLKALDLAEPGVVDDIKNFMRTFGGQMSVITLGLSSLDATFVQELMPFTQRATTKLDELMGLANETHESARRLAESFGEIVTSPGSITDFFHLIHEFAIVWESTRKNLQKQREEELKKVARERRKSTNLDVLVREKETGVGKLLNNIVKGNYKLRRSSVSLLNPSEVVAALKDEEEKAKMESDDGNELPLRRAVTPHTPSPLASDDSSAEMTDDESSSSSPSPSPAMRHHSSVDFGDFDESFDDEDEVAIAAKWGVYTGKLGVAATTQPAPTIPPPQEGESVGVYTTTLGQPSPTPSAVLIAPRKAAAQLAKPQQPQQSAGVYTATLGQPSPNVTPGLRGFLTPASTSAQPPLQPSQPQASVGVCVMSHMRILPPPVTVTVSSTTLPSNAASAAPQVNPRRASYGPRPVVQGYQRGTPPVAPPKPEEGPRQPLPLQRPTLDSKKHTSRKYRWNHLFQAALDDLSAARAARHMGSCDPTLLAQEEKAWAEIRNIESDFVHAAQLYGKLIVEEKFLPDKSLGDGTKPSRKKTIKKSNVGGIAGGQKFIVNDIIFKFATDEEKGTFQGDDQLAAKIAGHELKSCIRFFSVSNCNIRVPLMANLDYLGFRLTAMARLPIMPETLVYGSRDAGRTVHATDAVSLMNKICSRLLLKPHLCGRDSRAFLCGPVDIEIHRGEDGMLYAVDFSRLFPPEIPTPGVPGCYLHRLLRPELLQSYRVPLSSDAFSPFGLHDLHIHNTEVEAATRYLHSQVIPAFAKFLLSSATFRSSTPDVRETLALVPSMHKNGINVRHLGRLWQHVVAQDTEGNCVTPQPDAITKAKCILETEMASRVIKNQLRLELRKTMKKENGKMTHFPFAKCIVSFLNMVFSKDNGVYTHEIWKTRIIPLMESCFIGYKADIDAPNPLPPARSVPLLITLSAIDAAASAPVVTTTTTAAAATAAPAEFLVPPPTMLQTPFSSPPAPSPLGFGATAPVMPYRDVKTCCIDPKGIHIRLKEMMGLDLSDFAVERLFASTSGFELVERDLLNLPMRIKHMELISVAEGRLLAAAAQYKDIAMPALKYMVERFSLVASSNPTIHNCFDLGTSQFCMAVRSAGGKQTRNLLKEARCHILMAMKLQGKTVFECTDALKAIAKAQYLTDLHKVFGKCMPSTVHCIDLLGSTIACGGEGGSIQVLDLKRKTIRLYERRHTTAIKGITNVTDLCESIPLLTIDADGNILLFDKQAVLRLAVPFRPNAVAVFQPNTFAPVGCILVVAGSRAEGKLGALSVVEFAKCAKLQSQGTPQPQDLIGDIKGVSSIHSVTLFDKWVVTAGDDCVRLWDYSGREHVTIVWQGVATVVHLITENCLAAGHEDCQIRIFDWTCTSSNKVKVACRAQLIGHKASVACLSSSATLLVSGSRDCSFRLWDLKTCKCVKEVETSGPVTAIHISEVVGEYPTNREDDECASENESENWETITAPAVLQVTGGAQDDAGDASGYTSGETIGSPHIDCHVVLVCNNNELCVYQTPTFTVASSAAAAAERAARTRNVEKHNSRTASLASLAMRRTGSFPF
eukprot:TRINITY_DN390_c0_g1_i3.p1 TRINITY_DN390_c0_g1~~TRINITY_DN390_c0_g1_i3.p1  ORF type:complete len:2090 (-),score=509.34 TRINITY_DN390_c0_g1_i3:37-6306(-)